MALIDDFKTATGATEGDQYLIDYFLKPSIDKASELTVNKKRTVITLSSGIQSYDLTDSSIASPVVGASGIQDVYVQDSGLSSFLYKGDYYIQGLTTLYFVNTDLIFNGDITLVYNGYYSKPTTAPIETDMPTVLFPSVLRHAKALYRMDQMGAGAEAATLSGAKSVQESNLKVEYGSGGSGGGNIQLLQNELLEAEKDMINVAGLSKNRFYSISII